MGTTTVLRFHQRVIFDKYGSDVHPRWAMTTARTRIPALSGLILFVVILILP
jgi:hypothetical protein